ncbi:MAG: SEL1-like repeat protein [Alphaproteobacteria bacterium]
MAQAALGAMYEKGQGTRKDIVRALMYYELVIERFDRRTWQYRDVFISKRRVGTLMTAEQISEAKQLSKNWTKENPVDGNR